jgi:hypothetical protein
MHLTGSGYGNEPLSSAEARHQANNYQGSRDTVNRDVRRCADAHGRCIDS